MLIKKKVIFKLGGGQRSRNAAGLQPVALAQEENQPVFPSPSPRMQLTQSQKLEDPPSAQRETTTMIEPTERTWLGSSTKQLQVTREACLSDFPP